MADLHALGPSGGAGGEDHIGQIIHIHGNLRHRIGRSIQRIADLIEIEPWLRAGPHTFYRGIIDHHQRRSAVLQNDLQPLCWQIRIKRHISAARLHHAKQNRHGDRFAIQTHTHKAALFDTARNHQMRQFVRQRIKLRIAQRIRAIGHLDRDFVALHRRLTGNKLMHGLRIKVLFALLLAARERNRILPRQIEQIAHRDIRVLDDLAQHRDQTVLMALNGALVKDAGVIHPLGHHFTVGLGEVEEDLEIFEPARVAFKLHRRAIKRNAAHIHTGIDVEHHRRDLVARGVPLDLQKPHQRAIGEELMVIAIEHGRAHAAHQIGKALIGFDLCAQRHEVNAMAHQPFHIARRLPCRWQRHGDIAVSGNAREIEFEGGQKRDHHGRAFFGRHALEPLDHIAGHLRVIAGCRHFAQRLARPVRGQIEHRRQIGKLAGPIVFGGFGLIAHQPGLLGLHIIDHTVRARQFGNLAFAKPRVDRAHIMGENGDRPAIENDMMGGQNQIPFLRAQFDQNRPRQRGCVHIKRHGHFFIKHRAARILLGLP